MKPKEALDLLDKNIRRLQGTFEDHVILQEAVKVLDEVVNPKKEEEPTPKPKT